MPNTAVRASVTFAAGLAIAGVITAVGGVITAVVVITVVALLIFVVLVGVHSLLTI